MSWKTSVRMLLLAMWACGRLHAQDKQTYALKGTLATPTDLIPGGTVVVSGEKIDAVGLDVNLPPQISARETDSFIFPGLIDLHNHLTWNLFPRWQPKVKFSNRYEWQQSDDYKEAVDTPHRLVFEENWKCEMNLYGEVKAIVGGATSSVGSLGPSAKGLTDNKCIEGLARNLDFYSGSYQPGVVNAEKLRYEVFPLELSFDDAEAIRKDLASGQLRAFVVHLAEGKPGPQGKPGDASAAREHRMMSPQSREESAQILEGDFARIGFRTQAVAHPGWRSGGLLKLIIRH